ncbi:MAG: phospho-sugar mutase [Spirochaetales bacterium]|nr:phospho-sugar mutase [Spirochaetales bacterium]
MDKEKLLAQAKEYISLEKDQYFKAQVQKLIDENNWEELNDCFYTELAFGTGGLRGLIGGGYNRMNSFMVQRATQGLANYIKKAAVSDKPAVVIAHDSRHFSDTFALDCAKVLSGNGIKAYLFTGLRPTPELSFAVRYLKATAGIVITASHNPKEYNGYKAFWDDGAQVLPPHDKGIIDEVRSVTSDIKTLSKEDGLKKGLIELIDKDIDHAFIEMVKNQALRPDLIKEKGKDLKIVYTPLCGAGMMPVSRALEEMGIKVSFVEDQKNPQGDFAGLKYPNPEEASAMAKSLELAKKVKADLVFGTDPDADRLGIAVPDGDEYRLITGNQLGVLLEDYIFSTRKELGTLPSKPAFIKTIVTTELQRLIAEDYEALCIDTLTGFKYIGEKIREFEAQEDGPSFIMGDEESYGFLIETEVRDKDAVSAATMTCEMALYHVSQGKSVLDRLNEIYDKYGYFEEALISQYFEGESGLKVMTGFMAMLRDEPPKLFAGEAVSELRDFKNGTTLWPQDGKKKQNIDLPSSNVLQFVLVDGSIISVRPSGTEPKIKFYASCCSEKGTPLKTAKQIVGQKIEAIKNEVKTLIAKMHN